MAEIFTDWPLHLTVLLLAAVAAGAAGVGVWAACSNGHWFWRALAVWGCVAILLPIRVYEPAIVLAMGLPLLVVLLLGRRIVQRLVGGREVRRLWFSLADIGLAVVIVALSLIVLRAIASDRPEITTYSIIVPAALFAALAAMSYWIAVGPRRWLAIGGVMLLVSGGAWLLFPKVSWLLKVEPLGFYFYDILGNQTQYWRGLAIAFLLASLFVFFVIGLSRAARSSRRTEKRRFASIVRGTSLTIAIVFFGGFYVALLWLSPFPPPLLSEDDHGRQIMKIVEQVGGLNGTTASGRSPATLSSLSPEVAAPLSRLYDELEKLLVRTNSMPFDPESDSTDLYFRTTNADQISALRDTGRCFAVEWKEADARGDRQRSLDKTISCLRLGTMWCRNSIMVNCLVGHALIGMSYTHLIEQRKSFTPEEAERVIAAIRRAESEHEASERIIQRDIALCERAFGWQARFSRVMDFRGENDESAKWVQEVIERWRAHNRLLMTDLAIQNFWRLHDSYPRELDELVPKYLEAVPTDPFSGRPLVYRLIDDGFLLYSVGQDRVDNGGLFGGWLDSFKEGFDLDVEARSRAESGS